MSAVLESDEDLEVFSPRRARVVRFRGEDLEIRPLTVRQIPEFTLHVRPILAAINERFAGIELAEEALLKAVNVDAFLSLIESNGSDVIAAVAAATGRSSDWVGDGEPDEFLELTVAVAAANMDFFAKRLLPAIARNFAAISGGGRTQSSSS